MASTLADYLGRFEKLGDEIAYAERQGYRTVRYSYRRVAHIAYGFAAELEARGIRKGDRVMLWSANSATWVAAFFGCAYRGVIAVPMDDAASPDFAARVLQNVGAKLLVCSREHALQGTPSLPFEEIQARESPSSQPESVSPQDSLQIVFTSGTTGDPKGVVITHGNVLSNVAPLEAQIAPYLKYERLVHPIRFLNLLPLSHVFGQFLAMYLPSLLRGTIFFQETLKPAEVINTIQRERISVLVAVPRMTQSLKEKIERDLKDDGKLDEFRGNFRSAEGKHFLHRWWMFRRIHRQFGWKFWAFISGGAALDADTEEFWRRLGYAVIQGYGLTETTSLISVNHPFKTGKGSIGKVLAGREVKLAPDGEILVRGGGVASGYWNAGELRPVSSEEGWYHTGDIGELDREGNLYFKGRKKDVIVTPAGMNVYPEDVENAIKRQLEVKDCVVVPLAIGGNAEPAAAVITKNGNAAEAVDAANQQLAEYQRVRRWVNWPDEDFPRTSTLKPRRAEIAQTVQQMLAGSAAPGGHHTSISELLAAVTKRSVGTLESSADLDADLNLSSLERVELLGALEEKYQVDLSETRFSAIKTVADLDRVLKGEATEKAEYTYPAWAQRWPSTWIRFAIHYLLLRPAVFILGWPRIVGRENLCGMKGPLLVICNHIDDVDVGFVQTALPFRFRHKLATAAGGEALQALRTPPQDRTIFLRVFDRIEWFFGVMLLNLFPLPRQAGFRDSFRFAGESVDRGYSILVFPEGRHTKDGKMNPFRSGIGLLAKNLGIPVLPMRIDELFEVKNAGKRIARPYQISVKIGTPISFSAETDPESIPATLQQAVEQL
ncbi:MAG TPA: AMP-binding protein [Terriglobales bacterium]|nr:AMP-binding protein [Terriglobales bacterium]